MEKNEIRVYTAQDSLQADMILETLKNMIPGLMSLGYRLLVVAFIIIIGMRIISSVKKMFSRSFERMEMEISLRKFLMSVLSVAMYLLLALIAADKLGFNPASLIAVVGSAGVAVALSLQESLSNFAGGVLILILHPFRVGDYIIEDTNKNEGQVLEISVFYTKLRTVDNKIIVIPNGALANNSLTNATKSDKRQLDLIVPISYDADIRQAKAILERLVEQEDRRLADEEIKVFVSQLNNSSVDLGLRFWVPTEDYWNVRWKMLEDIKYAFDDNGIGIPYPQMDVHLDREGGKAEEQKE